VNNTEGSNTMSNELNNNNNKTEGSNTMMFMSDKERKRKTYDRGIIDGRLQFIDELECWIVGEIGKKEISEHYKNHNIEYTDGEVK